MRNFLYSALVVLSIFTEFTYASEKFSSYIIVNLEEGTVDGVSFRGDIDSIIQIIGEERVSEETELLENQPHKVYVIDFDGHKIMKHWNAISFTDPIFKLSGSNLGVESPVSEFDEYYGKGEYDWYSFHWWGTGEGMYHFAMFLKSEIKDGKRVYSPDQNPKEIWVW